MPPIPRQYSVVALLSLFAVLFMTLGLYHRSGRHTNHSDVAERLERIEHRLGEKLQSINRRLDAISSHTQSASTNTKVVQKTVIQTRATYYHDDESYYNYQNWESLRLNKNRELNVLPCKNPNATDMNHQGVDYLMRYIRDEWRDSTQSPNKAITYFERSMQLDPTCATPVLNLGILCVIMDDQPRAGQMLSKVLELSPNNARAYLYQGILAEIQQRNPQQLYEKARDIMPTLSMDFFAVRRSFNTELRLFRDFTVKEPKGREVQVAGVRKLLLCKEYQHLSLSGTTDLSRDKAIAFNHTGIIALPNMLEGYGLKAYQQYWWDLLAYKQIPFSDPQVRTRYHLHNDPATRLIHASYHDVVRRIAGRPTKPSYTYFGGYLGGSVLEPHVDRRACEFTLTFQIDIKPARPLWPFIVGTEPLVVTPADRGGSQPRPSTDKELYIELAPGDGGLIWGRRIIHYRDALPQDQTSLNVFMHFVYADFPEAEWNTQGPTTYLVVGGTDTTWSEWSEVNIPLSETACWV